MGWIKNFLTESQNQFLIEVDSDWIKDKFNHTDLLADIDPALSEKYMPSHYKGMRLIVDIPGDYTKEHDEAARFFYGLLHARYVLTNQGINRLLIKYDQGLYSKCPKVGCGSNMLPAGRDNLPGISRVHVYCPVCDDLFKSESELDSAYFGQNLPHMFFMVKKEKRPVKLLKKIYSFDEAHILNLTYPLK